jgi:hypothetical protein
LARRPSPVNRRADQALTKIDTASHVAGQARRGSTPDSLRLSMHLFKTADSRFDFWKFRTYPVIAEERSDEAIHLPPLDCSVTARQ